MSVVMILRVAADPDAMEAWSKDAGNRDALLAVAEEAKSRGVTRHLFAGGDGEILVIDEWPDEPSFRGFFAEEQERIGGLMRGMGVSSAPEITVYRKLDTPDII